MIVALLLPPLIGVVAWRLIPKPVPPIIRGTLAQMETFLRVVKEPYPSSNIREAANLCFEVGAPASRYASVLAKADASGIPSSPLPGTTRPAVGMEYTFWCEGKSPAQEGSAEVTVITNGTPPVITHVWVDAYPR